MGKEQKDKQEKNLYYMPPEFMDYEEEEINLLDYAEVITSRLKFISIFTGIFILLGVVYALLKTPTYPSAALVVREIPSENKLSGAPLSALQSFGINLGGGSSGLTPETMPEILKSRAVRLAVANADYYFDDVDSTMSYINYIEQASGFSLIGFIKGYTIGLPGKIISLFKNDGIKVNSNSGPGVRVLSEKEVSALERLSRMLSVSVDRESGVMTIKIETWDPVLSTRICQEYIKNLQEKVREIYTEKARQNLEFVKDRFSEVKMELRAAENRLADFLDSNENPQTAKIQTEIDRLRRQVTFKTQLYQELQNQKTQAEINLKKKEPVITIIEKPLPSSEKSGPNRKLIVIIFIFLGGGLAVGYVFISKYFENLNEEEEASEQLNNIKKDWKNFLQSVKNILK